jgi:hypothetical protein
VAKRASKPGPPAASASGIIRQDEWYTLPAFKRTFGISDWGLRSMRRAGLRIAYFGGRGYVSGRSVGDFLESQAKSD